MSQDVMDQIIAQMERLADPQQRQVLDYARALGLPAGRPGTDLLRFAGTIDKEDLDAMSRAIEEGCERVQADAW
jgi:hypothetical protein